MYRWDRAAFTLVALTLFLTQSSCVVDLWMFEEMGRCVPAGGVKARTSVGTRDL